MNITENDTDPEGIKPVHAEVVDRYTLNPGTSAEDDAYARGYRTEYQINGKTVRVPDVKPVEPRAVVAMTLALLSWVIIPVIGAIIAIWYGITAKQHIRWSDGRYTGSTMASIAIGVSIANIVVVTAVIALVVWAIGAIF